MNKNNFIKQYMSFLTQKDVVVLAGKSICQESSNYVNSETFRFDDDYGYGMSLALGMAMGTNKRVYIICDDYYLLKDLCTVAHMGISKLSNLFIVIIVTGYYPFTKNMPTIATSLPNIKGLLFSSGFTIHDYTAHFKTQVTAKAIKSWITTSRGPLAVFMYPDKTKETYKQTNEPDRGITFEQIIKLKEALKDETTSLFTPPFIGWRVDQAIDQVEEK